MGVTRSEISDLVDEQARKIEAAANANRARAEGRRRSATRRSWRRRVVKAGEQWPKCTVCGHSLAAGDEIVAVRSQSRVLHAECADELAAMAGVRSQFERIVEKIRNDREMFDV